MRGGEKEGMEVGGEMGWMKDKRKKGMTIGEKDGDKERRRNKERKEKEKRKNQDEQ